MPETNRPDPERRILAQAADLIEANGWSDTEEPSYKWTSGPIHLITAIGKADDCLQERDYYSGDAMMLLVAHLFRTQWEPRWREEITACTGCQSCTEHREEPGASGHGSLYMFTNGCSRCVICDKHSDAPFMNPASPLYELQDGQLLYTWLEVGCWSAVDSPCPPTPAEVVSTLRAAAE